MGCQQFARAITVQVEDAGKLLVQQLTFRTTVQSVTHGETPATIVRVIEQADKDFVPAISIHVRHGLRTDPKHLLWIRDVELDGTLPQHRKFAFTEANDIDVLREIAHDEKLGVSVMI